MKRFAWLLAASIPLGATAQSDVTRLIVAAPAGGGTDTVFRILAKEAGPLLSQTLVVQNLPGAQGIVAMEQLMSAPANGRTLVGVPNSSITATPHILKVPFGQDDYQPLIGISSSPYAMCVRPAFAAASGKEFIMELKRKPDAYTIGTDGGAGQLASARALVALGAQARNIPFKGASEILAAFLGEHVDIYNGSVAAILPSVKAGKAKCLLLTTAERSPALSQAAGLREMGIPQEETPLWWILVVHKSTPPELINRITDAATKASSSSTMRQYLADTGNPATLLTGPELRQRLQREYDALAATSKALGMTPP